MTDKSFTLPTRQQKVFHYQYGHRLLGHGKLCPWCKEHHMIYETMELVYRIPITLETAGRLGSKILYHRLNWDWVCGSECAQAMTRRWRTALIPQKTLADKIAKTETFKTIDFVVKDGYREMVLKLCRLDPKLHIHVEIIETSLISTILHLTK